MAGEAHKRLIETHLADSPGGLAPVKLLGQVVEFCCCDECHYGHAGVVVGYTITDAHGLVFTLTPRLDPHCAHMLHAEVAVPARQCRLEDHHARF